MAERRSRRRKKKTAADLRRHAIVSASVRYGIDLDDEGREEILEMIRAGTRNKDCACIERQSRKRTLWRIRFRNQVCGVVYDSDFHELVTFIPKDDPRL
jgi:hypothetical protein